METREYRTVNKSKWRRGEWDNEPDKVQFTTRAGLPGLVVRGPVGALCGYVGVTESHPWFQLDFGEGPVEVSVHGGLTYSEFCQPFSDGEEHHGVCHVPAPGEPDHVWWFGFDCLHAYDYAPATGERELPFAEYRTLGYVKRQVERLAVQLVEAAACSKLVEGDPHD